MVKEGSARVRMERPPPLPESEVAGPSTVPLAPHEREGGPKVYGHAEVGCKTWTPADVAQVGRHREVGVRAGLSLYSCRSRATDNNQAESTAKIGAEAGARWFRAPWLSQCRYPFLYIFVKYRFYFDATLDAIFFCSRWLE